METILVLSATGNIGRPLLDELLSQDVRIVAGVHNPQHVPGELRETKIEWRHFDFLNAHSFSAAHDADRVFFVRPPQLGKPKQDMFPFLDYLKQNGRVKQVVFVSMLGVDKNPVTPHHKIEKHIREIGLPHTFIRPSFFMQNLTTTHVQDIREHHDLFIPAGNSVTSFIDTRDIAAVAAKCLLNDQYIGQQLDITGGRALSYDQVAAIMSKELGTAITYSNPSLLHFRKVMRKRGIPAEFVNVMVMLYVITRLGNAKAVTDTLPQVLGREPITFEQFVADNRAVLLG
ncbi:SDR family oxidoreductase [Lacticaseibacillus hulanensis]|uniref:SDR family oxidoreductase n=1 Tax=Lacticaseibacillus hulanensis TaxID=2493111 RepID=UPI000FD6C14C|nr:SDR family oxidoreductase [Lacticaseibacillus hulanensis]